MEQSLAGKTILLLEDEPMIAHALQEELGEAGAIVFHARTCLDAMIFLCRAQVNCAVLDFHIGEEDCSAVAATCDDNGVPFIISTGADPEETDGLHATALIQKPFSAFTLLRLLAQYTN